MELIALFAVGFLASVISGVAGFVSTSVSI
jgi:uncharacterized membrane protein YfcA